MLGLSCQMMVQQKAACRRSAEMQSSEMAVQLQQAMEQISTLSTALCDIQRYYQEQVCVDVMKERNMCLVTFLITSSVTFR